MQAAQKEFAGDMKTELIIAGFTDALAQKSAMDMEGIENALRDLDKKVPGRYGREEKTGS